MSKKEIDPVLFEKFLQSSKQYAKASQKNKHIAQEWFKVANEDISVSKLCFVNKHYASSIYHLQQAFEKLTKCYYILSGRMEPDQARDHRFILNQLKKDIKDEYINSILELLKSISENTTNLTLEVNSLEILEKNEEQLRQIAVLDIEKFFNLFNALDTKLLNPQFILSIEKKIKQRKVKKSIRHIILKITHFRTSYSQVEEAINKKQVELYVQMSIMNIKLLFLSLTTYVHFNTPIYPSNKDSNMKHSDYSEQLGIVKKISLFHESFDNISNQ